MRPGYPTAPKCFRVEEVPCHQQQGKTTVVVCQQPDKYGKLWDPTTNDGPKVELHVSRMIALPLQAASLYRQLKGVVMLHELLDAMEKHLASSATSIDNNPIGD